jgi:hypothetical protein
LKNLISKLESIGFFSFNTRRIGPCDQCKETLQTYYIPETKFWLCESCYYTDESNREFISFLSQELSGINMANQPNIQELMVRLDKLEAENVALKAKATDNVFVGGTDNLTLKHRQANPRGWAVPTKRQDGQGFLRSGDFPMGYFINKEGTAIILHQEIPVSAREIQLFKDRYLSQGIVVAKRRIQDGQPTSTPSAPTSTTSVPTATPPASTTRSFASLTQAEKNAYVSEAQGLLATGLYTTLPEALESVLSGHKISK